MLLLMLLLLRVELKLLLQRLLLLLLLVVFCYLRVLLEARLLRLELLQLALGREGKELGE